MPHALVESWQINHRVTVFLIENFPPELWAEKVPGAPRRTLRMIAGHIHNCRCMWVKMLGKESGIPIPEKVDRFRVTPAELIEALEKSCQAITELIELALDRDGELPSPAWSNVPPEITHLVTYLMTHEGHHRGQLVMLARQLGHRLPAEVTNGLWQWRKRAQELDR